MTDNRQRGIYEKFIVRRTDGKDGIGEKHEGCRYFVLDLTHDLYALPAIAAYAEACAAEYPALAADLQAAQPRKDLTSEQAHQQKKRLTAALAAVPPAPSPLNEALLREHLTCRNGAPHYCPNCDNTINADRILAAVRTSAVPPAEPAPREKLENFIAAVRQMEHVIVGAEPEAETYLSRAAGREAALARLARAEEAAGGTVSVGGLITDLDPPPQCKLCGMENGQHLAKCSRVSSSVTRRASQP